MAAKKVLLALVITMSAVNAFGSSAPTSADELVKRLEQAVKAKNKAAVLELFCWDGVSKDMRTKQEAPIHILLDEVNQGLELTSVKAGPLPPDFQIDQVINGVKYHPNLPVLGVIHVMLAEDTNPTEFIFAYGKKDKSFFMSALVETKDSQKTDDKK